MIRDRGLAKLRDHLLGDLGTNAALCLGRGCANVRGADNLVQGKELVPLGRLLGEYIECNSGHLAAGNGVVERILCLLYTSPSPRDRS